MNKLTQAAILGLAVIINATTLSAAWWSDDSSRRNDNSNYDQGYNRRSNGQNNYYNQKDNYPNSSYRDNHYGNYSDNSDGNYQDNRVERDSSYYSTKRPNNDRVIANQIKDALQKQFPTAGRNIEITVVGRKVTLSGNVQSESERSQAASIAKGINGVRWVSNHLYISK
jgi:osmotically-inducible protein OsmY